MVGGFFLLSSFINVGYNQWASRIVILTFLTKSVNNESAFFVQKAHPHQAFLLWLHSTPQLSPLHTNYCRTTVAQWLAPQSTNVRNSGSNPGARIFRKSSDFLLRHLNKKKIQQQPPSKREERDILQPAAYNYHGYMKEENMRRDGEDGEKKKKKSVSSKAC